VDGQQLRIQVLGPLVAERPGAPVDLGGLRQRSVLGVLLVAQPAVVTTEALLETAWPDDARRPTRGTLQYYVSRLRDALGPAASTDGSGEPQVLVRQGPGYALRLEPDAIDAEQFTSAATRGRAELARGQLERAEQSLGRALSLWRGVPYADFTDTSFAEAEVARLTSVRAAAGEDLVEVLLRSGRPGEAVAGAEVLVREQPFAERGWALLARALYRSGRQADALARLREVRELLAEELGADPGPELRSVEQDVLQQDRSLDGPVHQVAVPSVPSPLTDLVGREEDVAGVCAQLAEQRLVTLVGLGGVGKTRLAVEVAHRQPTGDDVCFLELAGLEESGLLAGTIGSALAVPGVQVVEQLTVILAERRLLLVLDNCEHLVAAVADLVAVLLQGCPQLRVLATSREGLDVDGEVVLPVQPLAQDAAVELFCRRAAIAAPGWRPSAEELAEVQAISQALDGVPLAVELAAARTRVLDVASIRAGLDDRFALLAGGPRSWPDRHRRLEDTVRWSYESLDDDQARLLRQASVFAAPFDLQAVTAVAGASTAAVVEPLAGLVRRSLVAADTTTTPRRFRLLETVRQYAQARAGDDELAAYQRRHRAYVLRAVTQASGRTRRPDSAQALEELARLQPDQRAALASARAAHEHEYALELCAELSWFWYRRGHLHEGIAGTSGRWRAHPPATPAHGRPRSSGWRACTTCAARSGRAWSSPTRRAGPRPCRATSAWRRTSCRGRRTSGRWRAIRGPASRPSRRSSWPPTPPTGSAPRR
jgi:predicted ATPase/DNA-binding SARP family transcriptional activator